MCLQDVFLCHSFLFIIFPKRFGSFLLLTSLSQFWVSSDYHCLRWAQNTEFFLVRIFVYLDQKKLRIWKFSRSVSSIISYCKLCCLINAVSSDVIFLEFINSISAVSWNIRMRNQSYLVGREIGTLPLTLPMWPPVTDGINFFGIFLSRGSNKCRMFGMFPRM